MATANMNLDLPVVSVTLGPIWAQQLNDSLELVDAHDHTTGKGKKITPPAININQALDFTSQKATNMFSSQYINQASPLTGALNARSLHASGGDLYYTNAAGNAVQLTSGGALAAIPGSASAFPHTAIAGDLVINSGDTFSFISVDTTTTRQITLPTAGSVAAGRLYVIKDKSGQSQTNAITLVPIGGDAVDGNVGSTTLSSNYGSWALYSDGISSWFLF